MIFFNPAFCYLAMNSSWEGSPNCHSYVSDCLYIFFQFSYALGVIFLLEVVGAILAFVFSNEVKDMVTEKLQDEGIENYRDDPDFQSLIDWFQETVSLISRSAKCAYRTIYVYDMNKK